MMCYNSSLRLNTTHWVQAVPRVRGLLGRGIWQQKEKGKKREGRGVPLIYMENDVMQVKVGGEPSVFWEHGSLHLGNSSVGRSVTYVMSSVWEVLMPT